MNLSNMPPVDMKEEEKKREEANKKEEEKKGDFGQEKSTGMIDTSTKAANPTSKAGASKGKSASGVL